MLRALSGRKEAAELEGDLVFHLDFKRFDLIKARYLFIHSFVHVFIRFYR